MNKIQYIKLLALRGITELNGITLADAVKQSGGEPKVDEMVKVNEQSMVYYFEKYQEEKSKNEELQKRIESLQEDSDILRCLEAAGVDNWEGYDIAMDMRNH